MRNQCPECITNPHGLTGFCLKCLHEPISDLGRLRRSGDFIILNPSIPTPADFVQNSVRVRRAGS